ncbi:MAG: hypothetical protein ACKO1X_01855 [Acidimicrobiales bacterium]
MNVGILLIGLVAGVVIGGCVELQSRAARRRAESLARDGIRVPGTITSVVGVGKYASHRRIRVEVEGGAFVETMGFLEADELGAVPGATVTALIARGDPSNGRIDRPVESWPRSLGIWLGVFGAALGIIAAFVV